MYNNWKFDEYRHTDDFDLEDGRDNLMLCEAYFKVGAEEPQYGRVRGTTET